MVLGQDSRPQEKIPYGVPNLNPVAAETESLGMSPEQLAQASLPVCSAHDNIELIRTSNEI